MIIDGKAIAEKIIADLKKQPIPKKILAAVLVGENAASVSFLKQKEKIAKELGVDFRIYKLSEGLKSDGLRKEVGRIARQSRVGGIIVQLPLPQGINRRYVLNAIPLEKDVDVLSEKAQEAFRLGKSKILPPKRFGWEKAKFCRRQLASLKKLFMLQASRFMIHELPSWALAF
ncbi:hypothetical protein HYV91_02780 [Candidatus Wolfebacteria bacterium]|nr:hypothetical protein [Candidatus Wolfebacteria bacterium]